MQRSIDKRVMKDREVYERILNHKSLNDGRLHSLWEAVNCIYSSAMNNPNPSNGARVTQMRRVAEDERYDKVKYCCTRMGQSLFVSKKI